MSTQYLDASRIIQKLAEERGVSLYVVGGYVRDMLLGLPAHDKDIDFVVEGDAIDFARACVQKTGGELKEFAPFRTAKIINSSLFPDLNEIDFASSREEVYPTPGALPVVRLASLERDLSRRDFTVNAMALPVPAFLDSLAAHTIDWNDAVVDPFHGRADLHARLIRVLHEKSFLDDPTRLYRAIRYKVRLGGSFEQRTQEFFEQAVQGGALESVSIYRRFTEVRKIFDEGGSKECLNEAFSRGLLTFIGSKETLSAIFSALFERSSNPSYELFLKLIFASQTQEERESFAAAIQISKKKVKALLEDSL